jgi:hypothetical protein
MESDVITLQDVFKAKMPADGESVGPVGLLGQLEYCGLKPHFLEKMATNGVRLDPSFFAEERLARTDW